MSSMVKGWCFTINNPSSPLSLHETMKYMVYQLEEGENGTRHFQGYVEMKERSSLKTMKTLFPRAHLEKRKGTQGEARRYCMKEDSRIEGPWEFGEFKETIQDKLQSVLENMKVTGKRPHEYIEDCPDAYNKSKDTMNEFFDLQKKKKTIDSWTFREEEVAWQVELRAHIVENNPRSILWVYGPQGGEGKTTFARKLMKERECFYSVGGTARDVTYRYKYEDVVIFDIPRDKEDYLNYSLLEQFKNGIVQSDKYVPTLKITDPPIVIVFANFTPRSGMLSEDRIVIINC
uniref:Master replication protein n=1 Tax=Sophora yellow stunt virus TaxID=1980160 RepID=A0A1W5YSD7_9VIRU|nr:master replication initiator protein [Sophora yellow stunt virus]